MQQADTQVRQAPRVLAIIPAYNEEESIVSTVEELKATVPTIDFIVVNDGSRDRTPELCRTHGYPMLDLPANLGLTYGFQAGIAYAQRRGYDAAIQFDADGQHRPEYIPLLVDTMVRTGADIVVGSRFVEHKKPHTARMIGSRLIAGITRLTTGARIADPTSGMRLYRSTMFDAFCTHIDFGPEPDSIAYLIHHGARLEECQVEMREREAGQSYLTISRSIEYMLRTCVSILFVQWFR